MFIKVFEKMYGKYHYNMAQKWYSSTYALSDQYNTNASNFALFVATAAVKDFLYTCLDLEIWVLAISPISLFHTAGHTF